MFNYENDDEVAASNPYACLDASSSTLANPQKNIHQIADIKRPVASRHLACTSWHLVWTGDDKMFYHNSKTKSSKWQRPPELYGHPDVDYLINLGPPGKVIITYVYDENKTPINDGSPVNEIPQTDEDNTNGENINTQPEKTECSQLSLVPYNHSDVNLSINKGLSPRNENNTSHTNETSVFDVFKKQRSPSPDQKKSCEYDDRYVKDSQKSPLRVLSSWSQHNRLRSAPYDPYVKDFKKSPFHLHSTSYHHNRRRSPDQYVKSFKNSPLDFRSSSYHNNRRRSPASDRYVKDSKKSPIHLNSSSYHRRRSPDRYVKDSRKSPLHRRSSSYHHNRRCSSSYDRHVKDSRNSPLRPRSSWSQHNRRGSPSYDNDD